MGTVKYSGPVASFHCPTNAEIRSLKVHFSPKQEGSGDPSPENVREIVGWDGVEVQHKGKNLYRSEYLTSSAATYNLTRTGLVVSSTSSGTYRYVVFKILDINENNIGQTFTFSAKCISATNAQRIILSIRNSNGSNFRTIFEKINNYVFTFTIPSDFPAGGYLRVVYYCTEQATSGITEYGDIQLELGSTATSYEPYHGSTTNYEFGVLGKNKLNVDAEQQAPDNTNMMPTNMRIFTPNTYCVGMSWSNYYVPNNVTSYSVSDGTITVTNGNVYGLGYPVRVTPGQAYFLSATTTNGRAHIAYFASDGTYVSGMSTDTLNKSFTVPSGVETAVIVFYSNSGEATFSNIQLELGSTATEYEPYDPNHTVYGGWVDLISGEVAEKWIQFHAPNVTWVDASSANVYRTVVTAQRDTSESTNVLSDTYKATSANTGVANMGDLTTKGHATNKTYLYVKDTRYANAEEFAENTNAVIVYALKTPNTYHLAPTQLQTFLGHNNVWSNADYVEVEYDLYETQDILNRKNFIIANQPHIVRPTAADLQNFKTDMIAPLKECKVYFEPVQDLHGYGNPWPAGGGKNIAKPYDNSYISSTYISFDYSAADGTFRCYGTASASSTHSSPSATNAVNNGATFTLPAGTYTLSIIDGDGADIYAQCVSSTETVLAETTSYITFTTNESSAVFVRLKVAAAATVDKTVKIQLEKGSAATSYVPYENICPISGWTGFNLFHAGKNLLNDANVLDKAQIASGEIKTTNVYKVLSVDVPKNTDLRLSKLIKTGSDVGLGTEYAQYYTQVERIGSMTNYYDRTFSTGNNPYLYLMISRDTELNNTNVSWMLSIGRDTTEYEASKGTSILPIDWTDSVGTVYGGYVDLVTGEVWETQAIATAYGDGTGWKWKGSQHGTYAIDFALTPNGANRNAIAYSHGTLRTRNSAATNYPLRNAVCALPYNSETTYARAGLPAEIDTEEKCREWITEVGPLQVAYELATPILLTTLTPTQLKTLRGINNIWSNANGNIDLAYWTH